MTGYFSYFYCVSNRKCKLISGWNKVVSTEPKLPQTTLIIGLVNKSITPIIWIFCLIVSYLICLKLRNVQIKCQWRLHVAHILRKWTVNVGEWSDHMMQLTQFTLVLSTICLIRSKETDFKRTCECNHIFPHVGCHERQRERERKGGGETRIVHPFKSAKQNDSPLVSDQRNEFRRAILSYSDSRTTLNV